MIRKIGIIGSGKMGQDIFNYLNDFDFQLVWFVRNPVKKDKLEKSFLKKNTRQLKHHLITKEQFEQKIKNQLTHDLSEVSDCDLIIETIIENKDAKLHTFSELKSMIGPGCMVVSNSSSILPSWLSTDFPVAGMHFFYPIAFKNIVELVLPDNFDSDRAEGLKDFLSSINKKYVIQNERNAFLLNRFLLDLQVKAFHFTTEQNIPLQIMENASQTLITDFGLFEMMDHVGLATMYQSIQNYALLENATKKYDALLALINRRMAMEQPMLGSDSLHEVDEKLNVAVLEFLQKEIQKSYDYYFSTQPHDAGAYQDALREFCGLEM
ncbi:MAG: 3-hydroxyacyl-CoA dehydrogenase NAD-binding domain-containing protein [Bacteroidales bacterium]